MIVQRIEECFDFLARGGADFGEILGDETDFGGGDVPTGGFERFRDVIQIFNLGEKSRAFGAFGRIFGFERLDFLRACFDGIAFGIAVYIGVSGFDDAEMVEEKGDAAGLTERAGFEQITDFRRGAIAIVGEAFDDDGDFVGRETFVDDGLEIDLFIQLAGAFFDGALDGIAIDGSLFGFFDRDIEAGVEIGVRAAEFGRDHDFADQFGGHLAFFLRAGFAPGLFPLCAQGTWIPVLNGLTDDNILFGAHRSVNLLSGFSEFQGSGGGENPKGENAGATTAHFVREAG
jgi:hypothetical protein